MRTTKLLPMLVAALLLAAPPARAAVAVLVVNGDGFGHGVGMAQDGAYWKGRAGATTPEILGQFYPGVGLGRASGTVRVVVLTDDHADLIVTLPQGGEIRSPLDGPQSAGFPVAVAPGGAVRIRHDGDYHVDPADPVRAQSAGSGVVLPLPPAPGTSSTTALVPSKPSTPSTTTTVRPPGSTTTTTTTTTTSPSRTTGRSVWAVPVNGGTVGVPDRSAVYRGVVEATAGGGPLRLVDQLDVEQYLRGMGEVRDPSWPAASLRAQAIVARTYALRAMAASGEICDTQRCQVYLGQQAEYPAMDRAVTATAGQTLMYRGHFAAAVYSANGAGMSASPQEGFGTPDSAYPYLRATSYETHSPDPWEARIALTDLAARVHYRGTLSGVMVTGTGPSGRPTTVRLDGSAGPLAVSAVDLDDALALRSTKWTTRVELGTAPAPPPPAAAIQAFPDDVGAVVAAPPTTTPVEMAAPAHIEHHRSGRPIWPLPVLALAAAATVAWRLRRRPQREAAAPKGGR